jgi:hypothetical protein
MPALRLDKLSAESTAAELTLGALLLRPALNPVPKFITTVHKRARRFGLVESCQRKTKTTGRRAAGGCGGGLFLQDVCVGASGNIHGSTDSNYFRDGNERD